jgi:hypothetical protein
VNKIIKEFLFKNENLDWFIFNSGLPWLRLDINVPYKDIYKEALDVSNLFLEYRESSNKGWKGICIHGVTEEHIYDYTAYNEFMRLDQKNIPYKFTNISKKCPVTTNFLKTAFFRTNFFRVRFMLLEPGGFIEPHVDMPKKTLAPINIAINNPEKCVFKMKGYGFVPFVPGAAFMLDTSNEHAVYNGSQEPRIHMIVHCDYENLSITQKEDWNELVNRSLLKTLSNTKLFG